MGFTYLIKHSYVLCGGPCPLSQFQLAPFFTALSELAVFCSMSVEVIKAAMDLNSATSQHNHHDFLSVCQLLLRVFFSLCLMYKAWKPPQKIAIHITISDLALLHTVLNCSSILNYKAFVMILSHCPYCGNSIFVDNAEVCFPSFCYCVLNGLNCNISQYYSFTVFLIKKFSLDKHVTKKKKAIDFIDLFILIQTGLRSFNNVH